MVSIKCGVSYFCCLFVPLPAGGRNMLWDTEWSKRWCHYLHSVGKGGEVREEQAR